MVYEGYLKIGNTEIVNNERVRGFTRSTDCPLMWVRGPECDGLQEALEDEDYTHSNIPLAPWYDLAIPDLSGRFYGIFGLEISGLSTSTRSASATEGIQDGGVVGRTRKGMRGVRVRGTLIAEGRDALDYGVSWLNSALDPDQCGQHGGSCGTTDMEYFTDCPPARAMVSDFTPWVDVSENLFLHPIPDVEGDWEFREFVGTATPDPTVSAHPGGSSLRIESNGGRIYTSLGAIGSASDSFDDLPVVMPDTEYTVSAWVQSDVAGAFYVQALRADGSNAGNISGQIEASPTSLSRREYTFTTPAETVRLRVAIELAAPLDSDPWPVAESWVADPMLNEGPVALDYFDGNTLDDSLNTYSWADEMNFSKSLHETRETTERLQTEEEYIATISPLRRFLHDVSVTSGPIPVQILKSKENDGFYGMTMEWTITSERAWIYSLTRDVQLPLTPSFVIDDLPVNLFPYPSAELAGDPVVVSTNYSLNPSLESNANGWSATAGSYTGSDPTPFMTSGRVTNELQAVGTSSFRARLLGSGTAASGRAEIYVDHDVDISARPDDSRVSVSVWSALLVLGGASVTTLVGIAASIYWLDSSGVPISSHAFAQPTDFGGHVFEAESLVPPAGAVTARVRLVPTFDWASGSVNSDVRFYADAVAVTVP